MCNGHPCQTLMKRVARNTPACSCVSCGAMYVAGGGIDAALHSWGRLIVSEPSLQTPPISPWLGLCQQGVRRKCSPTLHGVVSTRCGRRPKQKAFGRCSSRSSDLARQLPSVRVRALARPVSCEERSVPSTIAGLGEMSRSSQ